MRCYLHQREWRLRAEKRRKRKAQPALRSSTGRRALRALQLDEHQVDGQNRLNLQLNDELIPLRLARCAVLVGMDVDTECVLGYHLALSKDPNQTDLLTLFDHCLSPWDPLPLTTPGLSYQAGAMFPSGSFEGIPVTFGEVQLDNALIHKAHSVTHLLCEQLGATVHRGLPAHPTVRSLIESIFNYIERSTAHRMASTTGSYPHDPKRESRKNLKRPPTTTIQALNEALSVVLTEYNVTPRANLGGASPLELFRAQCKKHFIRFIAPTMSSQWSPFQGEKVVPIHWNRHTRRNPYVNFEYVRYHGPALDSALRAGKAILLRYDRRDLRSVEVFTIGGRALGAIYAPQSWRRFPHSLATRRLIIKFYRKARAHARDPLGGYFAYLLEHKEKPKYALQLARIANEFKLVASLDTDGHSIAELRNANSTESRHSWTPTQAYHRS
ncbi:MAG: Mu transposase C-terminal domain-containing protein [Gammaproteobacteria bacterium]|nr:Mu transposase C-terminal domain-containing protein [Gammaproteobacteria bacterium]